MNQDLFWEKVQIAGKDDCWNWIGSLYPNGYGHFCTKLDGKTKNHYAHRLAVQLWPNRDSIEGKIVMHKCDNPSCCNPFHLVVGTQKENMADMRSKGRSAIGDRHRSKKHPDLVLRGIEVGNSKLDADKVIQIRALYSGGKHSLADIGEMFSVAFQTISKIINRKSWRHV